MNTEKKKALFRLSLMLIPIINGILVTFGWSPLPFEGEEIEAAVSMIAGLGFGVWAWWKNNSMTPEAIEAQKVLEELKAKK